MLSTRNYMQWFIWLTAILTVCTGHLDVPAEVREPEPKILNLEDYKFTLIIPLLRDLGDIEGILNELHQTPNGFRQSHNDTNTYAWGSFPGINIKIIILEEGSFVDKLHSGIDTYPVAPRQSLYLLFGEGASKVGGWHQLLSEQVVPSHIDEVFLAIVDTVPRPGEQFSAVYQIHPKVSRLGVEYDFEAVVIPPTLLESNIFGLKARELVLRFCDATVNTTSIMEVAKARNIKGARLPQHVPHCSAYSMYHADLLMSEPGMGELVLSSFRRGDLVKGFTWHEYNENVAIDVTEGNKTTVSQSDTSIGPLCYATRYGFERMARLFIDNHANLDEPCGIMGTLVQGASYHGHNAMIRLLLESGADPNHVKSELDRFSTPLINAIRQNHHQAVEILLKHGADVHVPKVTGHRNRLVAIRAAVAQWIPTSVETMLEYVGFRQNANVITSENTVFDISALHEDDVVFQTLLEHIRAQDIRNKGEMLCAAMTQIAGRGQVNLVKQLLAEGAKIDCCSESGSPLGKAARSGNIEMVKVFLDTGADPRMEEFGACNSLLLACNESRNDSNTKDISTKSYDLESSVDKLGCIRLLLESRSIKKAKLEQALLLAAMYNLPMVKLLMEYGAPPDGHGPGSEPRSSPLQGAILSRQFETVKFLLENGAKIREPIHEQHWGNSHLLAAIAVGDARVLQVLLDNGARIESAKDFIQEQGYVTAVHHGRSKILEILLQSGADVNSMCDGAQNCPIMQAIWKGSSADVEMLLKAGADPNRFSNNSFSAMQAAAGASTDEMVDLILTHGGDPNIGAGAWGPALTLVFRNPNITDLVVTVQLLLDHGANIHYQNERNETILEQILLSANPKAPQATQLLLDRGATNPDKHRNFSEVLERVATYGHPWSVEFILEKLYQDISKQEKLLLGRNALFLAGKNHRFETLEFMLQYGFSLDCSIECPLEAATKAEYISLVELLLDRANEYKISLQTIRSSLDWVLLHPQPALAELFLSRMKQDMTVERIREMLAKNTGFWGKLAVTLSTKSDAGKGAKHDEL